MFSISKITSNSLAVGGEFKYSIISFYKRSRPSGPLYHCIRTAHCGCLFSTQDIHALRLQPGIFVNEVPESTKSWCALGLTRITPRNN